MKLTFVVNYLTPAGKLHTDTVEIQLADFAAWERETGRRVQDLQNGMGINDTYDALESTAFGQTNHTFVKGLSTATVTLTLLMDYSSASSYALLQPLVGAAATYVAIKPTSAAISGTNPEFQLTNGLLTGMDYVNGQLGELQQFEVTFQGGTLVIDTTP